MAEKVNAFACSACEDWHYEGEKEYERHRDYVVREGLREKPSTRTWKYRCLFCERETLEYSREPLKSGRVVFEVSICKECCPNGNAGTQVQFSAWERNAANGKYALSKLERNAVYRVTKKTQWHHGTNIYLEGFGNTTFDLLNFTPVGFDRSRLRWVKEKLDNTSK